MNILDFVKGYVCFQGVGGFPEKFLTLAAQNGLHITDAILHGETLQATCFAAEYKRLRPIARRSCMRLRIRRKYGLYFHLFPYRKRWGLVAGVVLSALLLFVLSGRIWVVQVEADTTVDTPKIIKAVEKQGVYVGCKIDDVDMQLLRLQALSDLEDMVFLSVNPSGCVARVVVNKRAEKPSVTDFHSDFSNLVATRDGVILSTEIYSGQAAVQKGDGVSAGTLLVSGTVESAAGNLYMRRASGKVLAQTTRTVSVSLPFTVELLSPTNDVIHRPYLRFLKWDIPLFSDTPLPHTYQATNIENLLQTDSLTLPFGLVQKRFTRLSPQTVTRSEQTVQELAESELQAQLLTLRNEGVDIRKELDRKLSVEQNGVTLTAIYRCVENIAKEIPITVENFYKK